MSDLFFTSFPTTDELHSQTTPTKSQQTNRTTGRRCIHCAAWIYTKEDCFMTKDDGDQEYPCDEHPELSERIFNDIGNNDYIYQVIQESVDEATEEQYMAYQQELVEVE